MAGFTPVSEASGSALEVHAALHGECPHLVNVVYAHNIVSQYIAQFNV